MNMMFKSFSKFGTDSHQSFRFPLVELLRNPLCSQVTSSYTSGGAAKQISLNSPKTRNSLSLEMMTALRREMQEVVISKNFFAASVQGNITHQVDY